MKIELDDLILEHPKFVLAIQLAGSDAWFLWSGLRAYCSRFLTDGEVPEHMIGEVRGPKDPEQRKLALDALKTARLVDETEGGIALHDYLDWAASRDQVLAWRKANADRKKASRGKSMKAVSGATAPQNDHMSRCDYDVTPLVVTVGVPAESACSHGGSPSGVPAPSPSQISHSYSDTSDEVSCVVEPPSSPAAQPTPPLKPKSPKRTPEVPNVMPTEWVPSDALVLALAEKCQTTPERIRACVPEFRVYWTEGKGSGTRRGPRGWATTFAKRIQSMAERGDLYVGPDLARRSQSDARRPPQPNDEANRYQPRMFGAQ